MDRRTMMKLAVAGAALTAGDAAAQPRHQARARAPESIETRDGVRLFVRDWGSGPPVLFLAGWTLGSDFWCYQMAALQARGLRCIAFDRRGHGRSADPGGGYDFDTLADDVAAVIERLGLRGVTLVGHSMASGEIARYVARHGTRRLARITFVSPTTPFIMRAPDNPEGVPREALVAGRAPLAIDFPNRIGATIRPIFAENGSAEMLDWVKGMMVRTSLQAALDCARAMQETDFRADLPRIDVPTLVIHGDSDRSAPLALTARRTAALIPSARLTLYEGAPHGLPLTHVERLNADLLGFIRG